jgi:metallophosphoesterase (TIGR00282 family)
MKILMLGDILGEPGRKAVAAVLPLLKKERGICCVTANVENLAGGFGVSEKTLKELQNAGVDAFTSGNHIWDKKEAEACWKPFPTLLRPANYPGGVSGRGECLFTTPDGETIGILNVMGRVFMPVQVDDPFLCAKQACARLRAQGAKAVLVDVHAETTSEKVALWRWLDGEASVVAGTHTHVPTADARVSGKGTAFVTDLGICGGYGGVIGMEQDTVLRKFLQGMPARYTPEQKEPEFWGLLVELDKAGRAVAVEMIQKKLY